MLVNLYRLKEFPHNLNELESKGVSIRRAYAPERHSITEWVKKNFSRTWVSECERAFAQDPISCIVAIKEKRIVGFACYDATCKCFFGPTGVEKAFRGLGIGKGLLHATLQSMEQQGYAYAIIGDVGPTEFYAKTVGALEIEGSERSIYSDMIIV